MRGRMGQDWPKGNEPACGKVALGMLITMVAILVSMVAAPIVWAFKRRS